MASRLSFVLIVLGILAFVAASAPYKADAQGADSRASSRSATAAASKQTVQEEAGKEVPPEKLSVTHHSIVIDGKTVTYTATAGRMAMRDEAGKLKAQLFFTSYVMDGHEQDRRRPITFAFNGGPGAASLWLHLAAIGPKRVLLTDETRALTPPYERVTNEYTWLDITDLVFIDPVGTGYSRSVPGVDPKEFYGVKGDTRSVADFIRLFCTRYQRWLSPKFLAGESYGTTRAALLSGYLQDKLATDLDGIILISSALDFQTISFGTGNDLPYALYLPAYANAAWYHKKLPPSMQGDPEKTRGEVERFALDEYLVALAKGNSLSGDERERIVDRLATYTGLSKLYIRNSDLRIGREGFMRELLREEHRRVGMFDARITGTYLFERLADDPSFFNVLGPLVAAWNDYAATELKYENDIPYEFLSSKVNESWNWGSASRGYVNAAETLGKAMNRNGSLRVFMASGLYDLDTSYFATAYTINHLSFDPKLRERVTHAYYDAGHQMYTHMPSLKKLKTDVAAFVGGTLAGRL